MSETAIKPGSRVIEPGSFPGYGERVATVLRTDGHSALIRWTEDDGSATDRWVEFNHLTSVDEVFDDPES
jgi:hypothetical protein